MFEYRPHKSLDHAARLAQRLTASRSAFLALSDAEKVCVVGKDGVSWNELPRTWSLESLAGQSRELCYIRNVSRHPTLQKHPLRDAMPTLRKLLYAPFDIGSETVKGGIIMVDPALKWPFDNNTTMALTELAALAGEVIRDLYLQHESVPSPPLQGLSDISGQEFLANDAVCSFLLDTLQTRQSLKSRGDTAYTTLRTWRKPLKTYQIKAMTALKAAPPPPFISAVAAELANAGRRMIGASNISAVVNVPCGHARTGHCLSQMLAEAVAAELSVSYIESLRRQHRPGRSHPRRNARLEPFEVVTRPKGTVLLIDDVATSGRHLELAVNALRPHVSHVAALAWIGDT